MHKAESRKLGRMLNAEGLTLRGAEKAGDSTLKFSKDYREMDKLPQQNMSSIQCIKANHNQLSAFCFRLSAKKKPQAEACRAFYMWLVCRVRILSAYA